MLLAGSAGTGAEALAGPVAPYRSQTWSFGGRDLFVLRSILGRMLVSCVRVRAGPQA